MYQILYRQRETVVGGRGRQGQGSQGRAGALQANRVRGGVHVRAGEADRGPRGRVRRPRHKVSRHDHLGEGEDGHSKVDKKIDIID